MGLDRGGFLPIWDWYRLVVIIGYARAATIFVVNIIKIAVYLAQSC